MKPSGERRVPAKPGQLTEGAYERVLRELAGQVCIPRQPKSEPIDPGRVRVVQLARCDPVSGKDPTYDFGFAHLIGFEGNRWSGHVLLVRCGVAGKRSETVGEGRSLPPSGRRSNHLEVGGI
jgi:hypothetical protein